MLIQLESTETYISSLEICKENTIKEINGLKYPIKLFQKKKIKELNHFQSILIVSPHPPFLNEEGEVSEKGVKGQLTFGVIFSFLAIIITDTALTF